ncbi:MAG: hypothetical protein NTZ32_17245 [Planctomycetales bacterium]|nr:hypothetical protein [Planctomycetales bacterium]
MRDHLLRVAERACVAADVAHWREEFWAVATSATTAALVWFGSAVQA